MAAPGFAHQAAAVNPALGSLDVDVDTWPMMVRARIAECALSLPAGRWLAAIDASTAGSTGEPPLHVEVDETLASAGTVTIPAQVYRAIRPFTGTAPISIVVRVAERSGSAWVPHGGCTPMTIEVPTAPEAAGTDFGVHATSILLPTNKGQDQVDQELAVIMDAAADDGCGVIRCSFAWSLTQPSAAHTWDESICAKLDALHDECVTRGMGLVAIVGSVQASPTWCQDGDGLPTQAALDDYATEFVTRWPGVTAIEPDNEPDHPAHFCDPADYATAHNRTRTAFQAADATVDVGLGAFASANLTYIGDVLDAGITDFDAVVIHPYTVTFSPIAWLNPAHPPGMDDDAVPNIVQGVYALDELLRGRSLDKPIWITETGFASDSIAAPAGQGMSPQLAAKRLTVVLKQVARMSEVPVCCVHWAMDYSLQATGSWLEGFGLRMHSGGPRLAATAFHEALAAP